MGLQFSPPVVGTRHPSPASRWRQRREYVAIASYFEEWWTVELPQLPGVTASSSDQNRVEEAVRDVISLTLRIDPESFDVHVIFVEPDESALG